MIFFGGLQRNPFRFSITPTTNTTSDLYYDLSLAPTNFWKHVRSDGGDIRVTKQDGITPVAREVTAFDAVNKIGSLFIKVNSATSFYVYYGNGTYTEPLASATYGKNAVWETASRMVFHASNYTDSTSSGNIISPTAGVSIGTGKIRNGIITSLTSDLLTVNHTASQANFTELTLSFWINWSASGLGRIIDKNAGTAGIMAFLQSSNIFTMNVNGNSATTTNAGITSGNWHMITITVSSTGTPVFYINGSSTAFSGTCNAPSGITTTAAWYIMNRADKGRYLTGTIDEYRVLNRVWSATESAVHYSNQNAPGSFWTTSLEESV